MKLKEVIEKAVNKRDANLAGKVADVLWFKFGMNYEEVYEKVNSIQPISLPAWESLMMEADEEESYG